MGDMGLGMPNAPVSTRTRLRKKFGFPQPAAGSSNACHGRRVTASTDGGVAEQHGLAHGDAALAAQALRPRRASRVLAEQGRRARAARQRAADAPPAVLPVDKESQQPAGLEDDVDTWGECFSIANASHACAVLRSGSRGVRGIGRTGR